MTKKIVPPTGGGPDGVVSNGDTKINFKDGDSQSND